MSFSWRVGKRAASKPMASLSCDLDNKWAYLKTRGDARWKSLPCYLQVLVPRLLGFLKARNLRITVFIVGKDTVSDRNKDHLRAIAEAGHEIGNHTFHHEPWLHLYSDAQIEAELAEAEESIERTTGDRPVGFRGPGYSFSVATLRTLIRRGYAYDATMLPNLLNPLTRNYFLMNSELTPDEIRQRRALFGTLADGLRPVKPYQWNVDGQTLMEIPITTIPILKIPFHVSYILYLSCFSRSLALLYFQMALELCRITKTEPSLLLHSLDFLSTQDVDDLSFFPGMTLPLEEKLTLVGEILDLFEKRFTVLPIREYVRARAQSPALRIVTPSLQAHTPAVKCRQPFESRTDCAESRMSARPK